MSDRAEPTRPSTLYLDAMRAETEARARAAGPPHSVHTGAPVSVLHRLRAALEGRRERLVALSHAVHRTAEVAFEEHRSVRLLEGVLAGAGVSAEIGVHGLDTALEAGWGSADTGRTVALLAEYDALPGIGHACGHNVIAASAVGAFLAVVDVMRGTDPATPLPGRVVLLGTPAEEGRTGKEIMARHGAFAGIDAALMLHPSGTDAAEQTWLGRRTLDVTFRGIAAHASAQPFMGRNALDAAALMYQGIGLLRQQMLPVDRVHASIPDGGDRPSIITESARVSVYVRSAYPQTLRELSARVEDIARGAALMTGCGVEVGWDANPPSLPVRASSELAARWAVHEQARGRQPVPAGIVPDTLAASTDFGNVSWRMPGIHPTIAIADADVAWHTRAFADAAASPRADAAVVDGAYGLAATALDYLCDDALAAAVERDFTAGGGAIDVPRYFD